MKRRVLALTVASFLFSTSPLTASAQSLTTTFAGGNRQVGSMFDLFTLSGALRLTGIDLNIGPFGAAPADVNVYISAGGWTGKQATPGDWTLAKTVTLASAQPTGSATFLDLGTGIELSGGTQYGVYVMFANQPGTGASYALEYSNGANTYENADIRFESGIGVGGSFGPTFASRTFNGTFYYEAAAVPEPSAAALLLVGLAAVATVRRRREV